PEDRFADAGALRDALATQTMSVAETRPKHYGVSIGVQLPRRPESPAASLSLLSSFPAPPAGLSGTELRRWYKTQARLAKAEGRLNAQIALQQYARGYRTYDDRPLVDRVTA